MSIGARQYAYFSYTAPTVTYTRAYRLDEPPQPDVGEGVEVPPDVSYPPDDDGTPVVDDTTEGGD